MNNKHVIIVATSLNNCIGVNNTLPWHIPNDLKYFKEKTLHQTIVMGRKTFESIGRVLPNRKTIVLTKNNNFNHKDVIVYHDYKKLLKDYKDTTLYIVGGSQVYNLFYPYSSKLYVTLVDLMIKGDTYFLNYQSDFKQTNVSKTHRHNNINYTYTVWERKEV